MQNEATEKLPEKTEDEALNSILHKAKQTRKQSLCGRPADLTTLEEEARVLKGRQDPKLSPDRAFAVLDATGYLIPAHSAEHAIIENFVLQSMQSGWPENADGLTKVLMDKTDHRYLLNQLPSDLASYPRLTSAMTERLLLRPDYQDLEFAKRLRFGEHDLRSLIHQVSLCPRGALSKCIPDLLKKSRGSVEWRRVQCTCFLAETVDEDDEVDLIRCLDSLPMRWGARSPDFDLQACTPEVRARWVADLVHLAGEGDGMRSALLEGILWHGSERVEELVMTAAAEICEASLDQGSSVLNSLLAHPSNLVCYRAEALLRLKQEDLIEPDRPLPTGILDSCRRLAKIANHVSASPLTWIGDRSVELAIEGAVERAAATFTGSYERHWCEDEEPLTVKLLGDVRAALGVVMADINTLTGGRPGGRRISFSLHDRMVSKHEEGQPGINPDASFATDVCLIMTARRDKKVLANRATLIQVKKLKKGTNARWKNSFEIARQQLNDISKNTDAAFYMLMGPESAGRAIEIMPARLVAEYLPPKGSTVGLRREFVALASRSVAKWLTYDVVGLWTGDPKVDVVRKAAGADGRRPYLMVEIEVSISSIQGD